MKKEYVAPDLYFESFELSESVAAGCDVTTTNELISAYVFLDGVVTGCMLQYDETTYEIYCYWSGSEKSTQLFLS